MNDKKTYKITTNLFELKIFWNGKLFSTQVCIGLGLLLLKLFSTSDAVSRMCTIFIILDIASMLVSLFIGASIETVDESKGEVSNDKPVKEDLDVTVEHSKPTKSSKEEKKKSSKRSNEIRNKVPIPNPTPVKTETGKTTEASVVNAETPRVDTSKSVDNTEERKVKPVDEMTAEDWEELFKMN